VIAGQVRSWDSDNQRGGDLFDAGTGDLAYSNFEQGLLDRGHTVFSGVSALSPENLSEVEVFFWGTSSHVLSPEEEKALDDFVQNGGCLILETNSLQSEADAANSAYNALGLGPRVSSSLGLGQGVFQNVEAATTVGPLGDLRGQSFTSSLSRDLDFSDHTLVGVTVDINDVTINSMVEFMVGDGMILGVGDPYGLNLFKSTPNNLNAYLNFIENCMPASKAPAEAEIEIKPGGNPNSINCNNDKGVIAVAILTTVDFDVTMVDHTTVSFEGATETHIDKKTGLGRRHEEDVDGDGDTDLVFHFRYADTEELTCDSVEATLIGELLDVDGTPFMARSEVRMVSGTRIITVQ
jgi:hypothetical protein